MKEEHTIWAVIIFILQFSVAILPGLVALFHKEIRAFFNRDSDDD